MFSIIGYRLKRLTSYVTCLETVHDLDVIYYLLRCVFVQWRSNRVIIIIKIIIKRQFIRRSNMARVTKGCRTMFAARTLKTVSQ